VQTIKLDSRKFVLADPSKCTGCGICEYACAQEKTECWDPLKSRIRVIRLTPMLNTTLSCRFCKDAPCAKACQEKAIVQAEKTGLLIIDQRKCNGCDWCIQACPYGGLILDPDKRVAIACDLCDGEPKCIESCPEDALELVSDDEAVEKKWNEALEKIPLQAEKITDSVKKRQWKTIMSEAERRAKKTTEKLETISKRKHPQEK
jgi:carbon-monoxide dehydrogenase iron sulfur subunit